MKKRQIVKPPSPLERITLQLMIIIGIVSMGYFLYNLLLPEYVGFTLFYWVLIFAVIFNCLKILHEWYHYFFISVPKKPSGNRAFTVDIITTFCPGEPYEMIEETLTAIQAIRHHHTTYLGDEGNDPYIKSMCDRLGVIHVTRTDRKDAKAGNINNILTLATGDLCVVLDPDHVPTPDFLDRIVQHFNDPEIGYVQVVQAYKNFDESLVAKGAAQQTFQFYGPMMMTMNHYGTVMAIGANCTFRRAALDSIDGHAAGLAEDMHTAMQLHAKGWKSVYVPEVLTRGLVPATLSAYYKQQLKWARGTFELLFTTYPKLFAKFTWRQRIHYGTLPFHYFSGVICLINFLIPVLSLTLGVIPLKVDLITFAIIGIPFVTAVTVVRHYVQRWVMEEEERGFHMVGGLLLIGAWWIYILGLVYTITRKKIPYIPTPKDANTRDGWAINFPNITVAVISIAAIIYGLITDWNPYAIFMACVTLLNVAFMVFIIFASRQRPQHLRHTTSLKKKISGYARAIKRLLWLFRHRLYSIMRVLALPWLLIVIAFTIYAIKRGQEMPAYENRYILPQQIFYFGAYHPVDDNGLPDLEALKKLERSSQTTFDIISMYIPWGIQENALPSTNLLEQIYTRNAVPLITWEPWVDSFQHDTQANATMSTMQKIRAENFDDYITNFALALRDLHRPVYLRFAHEFDNPAYPWFSTADSAADDFKDAWIHIHKIFEKVDATNVIWVWSPWKPAHAEAYFPGESYVDWLSITALDYASHQQSYSFKTLYASFHDLSVFKSGLPVMLTETGTLQREQSGRWLNQMFTDIKNEYPEIKACILFNSAADKNVPSRFHDRQTLDWTLPDSIKLKLPFGNRTARNANALIDLWLARAVHPKSFDQLDGHGMNFSKGKNWFKNFHALTRRELEDDVRAMRSIGVSTIKRYGPGIYDRNIFKILHHEHMHLHYNFWIDDHLDVLTQRHELDEIEANILSTVADLKDEQTIIAWNLDNQLWHRLAERYPKPEIFYHQQAYLTWVNSLIKKIKSIDGRRPVTLDLRVSDDVGSDLKLMLSNIEDVDGIGLALKGDDYPALLDSLQGPIFFSEISVRAYLKAKGSRSGVFIAEWQDLRERNIITTDGLLDHWGRSKPDHALLEEAWREDNTIVNIDTIPLKILRPAVATIPGTTLTYNVIKKVNNKWSVLTNDDAQYEWYLLKTDSFGNNTFMKKIGNGTKLNLQIPEDPLTFNLYLIENNNGKVKTAMTTLNTPLETSRLAH